MLVLFLIFLLNLNLIYSINTVVIDTAGFGKKTGREIALNEVCTERSFTHKLALEIKSSLQEKNIRIIITKKPTDILDQITGASISNTIDSDIHISLGAYKRKKGSKHIVYLYNYSQNPARENLKSQSYNAKLQDDSFQDACQAYLNNFKDSELLSLKLKTNLTNNNSLNNIEIKDPISAPVKSLQYIKAKSVYIEIAIGKNQDFNFLIDAIAETICSLIEY